MFILVAGIYIFIQTPFGQNWIARQVTNRLSRNLHTRVTVKHVDFSLFNRMHLEGLMIEDQKGDTLLYAGDMKVRITDWFIFKKNADLKYIGLENAFVKMQRTDSAWNHQFLFDYFSSTGGTKKKQGGLQLHLKVAELKNVTFYKKDAWQGQDMTARVALLYVDAKEIDFSKKNVDINFLNIDKPYVSISNYSGSHTPSPKIRSADSDKKDTLQWNNAGWTVHLNKMQIQNGVFKNDKQSNQPVLAYFDGRHILFDEINGAFSDVRWNKDTLTGDMSLATKERSGLEVKKFQARVKFTPQEMAFDRLEIQTNKSSIRNYFRMSYDDFGKMKNFIHSVNMQAELDSTSLHSDDLAFFAPALKKWNKQILLKGTIKGTVDAMNGRQLMIQAGNNTLLNGDISLTGLPVINETFIDFKANEFRTVYGDAVTFIPALRQVTNPDLKKIQYVQFKGSFTGFIRDFVTFGTLQTNLGTVKTDLNMKLPRGQEPIYSGSLSTDYFRLGELINNKDIGSVSFSATLKGKGFSDRTRNTLIDGKIQFAEYKKYRYEHIALNGILDKNLFNGRASINDTNANLDLNGIIDLNTKSPSFKLYANVATVNLKNLNLTKDDFRFSGKLNADLQGSSFDNFLGTATFTDAVISKNGYKVPFESLTVSSSVTGKERILSAVANEFNASITGEFNLGELPAAINFILNKYYPAYISAPSRVPRDQRFRFDISALYTDEYMHLIDSSITGFNNSHISGSLELVNQNVKFMIDSADIPQFKFRQYDFEDVKINASGNNDSLVLSGKTGNIRINDSLNIAGSVFNLRARNDSSVISINTGIKQAVEKASINALVLTYTDGLKIKFDPSNFSINGKVWTIDKDGELEFRSSKPAKGQLVLQEGEQIIRMKTQPSEKGNWNDLNIELTKVNIGDFAPYFMTKTRLEGILSGTLLAEDPLHHLKMSADEMLFKSFRLDNDSLDDIKTSFTYDHSTRELVFSGKTLSPGSSLDFNGKIFIGAPLKAINNNITLKAENYEIRLLERFLGNLFSDIRGYLTGVVLLNGDFSKLAITSKGRLRDAGMKVNFTQVYYKIKDTEIKLTPQEINLDGIVLTDTISNNPVYVNGSIEHESFRNMFYDLYITTRKPKTTGDNNNLPVMLLNTTFKDNKQFYGNCKGTGSLSLVGPQSDMFMKIDAFASSRARDTGNITIPPSTSRETGLADFLVERKFGREMTESAVNENKTNITYDVDITANPRLNVKVALDELTGDEIKGKGNGTLKIRSGSSEPLSFRGRFDIEEGNYQFTFQSFFKKPFVLKKGTDNFIEWNGDPYDARINITATYTANNVSYSPLTRYWTNIDQKISNARSDVNVVAKLTDKLFSPQINFSLEFPTSSLANDDPALAFSLQQLQKNTTEMNKQATYLVVFGIFAPIENTVGSNTFQEIATTSLSGIFFNVINEQVKKIVSDIFKTEKLNFNFNSSIYNRNVIDPGGGKLSLGSNVNASIGSSFFKNKVIISLGGSVEGLLPFGTIQQNIQLLPNATIEILLNESGTFRANLFYRQNIDYLTTSNTGVGTQNRSGVGFSYRKEADTLWELIFKKKKPKEKN